MTATITIIHYISFHGARSSHVQIVVIDTDAKHGERSAREEEEEEEFWLLNWLCVRFERNISKRTLKQYTEYRNTHTEASAGTHRYENQRPKPPNRLETEKIDGNHFDLFAVNCHLLPSSAHTNIMCASLCVYFLFFLIRFRADLMCGEMNANDKTMHKCYYLLSEFATELTFRYLCSICSLASAGYKKRNIFSQNQPLSARRFVSLQLVPYPLPSRQCVATSVHKLDHRQAVCH